MHGPAEFIIIIYTDGSASECTHDGGAAAVITTGPADHPTVVDTLRQRGRVITSSYAEENDAMLLALEWIAQNRPQGMTVICSDSQSLLKAISNAPDDSLLIRRILSELPGRVVLQWIPGHVDVPGNEAADAAAKESAAITDAPPQPVCLSSALSFINRNIQEPPIKHARTAAVYEKVNLLKDHMEVESRKDAVLLAQIQSGHCISFKSYHHLMDPTVDPTCPRCGKEPHKVEHWLTECPRTAAARLDIFGSVSLPLSVLTEEPKKALLMSRRTL